MWTITQVKERGKVCYHRNYWRAVLVALIITLAGGMQGANVVNFLCMETFQVITNVSEATSKAIEKSLKNRPGNSRSFGNDYRSDPFDSDDAFDDYNEDDFRIQIPEKKFEDDINSDINSDLEDLFPGMSSSDAQAGIVAIAVIMVIIFLVLLFFFMILMLLAQIFLLNPLFIGTQRFFIHNLNADGQIGDLGFGFDRNYKNQVKIMFYRMLYTFAWSLLFVIPGIYKSYEYRMIPYLLAEYPNMDTEQAFYTSKYMMQGEKWKSFLLDLSFIGWFFLSWITCGIVGVFFTNPYYASTCAVQYEALKAIKGMPEYSRPNPNVPPVYPEQPGAQMNGPQMPVEVVNDQADQMAEAMPESEPIITPAPPQESLIAPLEDDIFEEAAETADADYESADAAETAGYSEVEPEDVIYAGTSQPHEAAEEMFVADEGETETVETEVSDTAETPETDA